MSRFIEMFGNPVTNSKKWPTKPISEVAPEHPSETKTTGLVWLLNLDMIESNTGKVIEKVYEDDSNLLSVAPFDEGNVLYSKLRPYLNKVVIPDSKGYATTELVPLRPNQELVNLTFFSHLLRGDDFVSYANGIATGTKMPRMPLNDLRKFNCILPPIEMQKEFEGIAHLSDKSGFDGLKSRFVEMFGSVDNNPKSYDIKKVGDFAECFAGATPSTKIPSYWDNGNIPWMSSGEVHKGRVQDTDAKITQQGYDGCSTKMVPIHSIVVALAGQGKTRGTVAINDIELCTNQSLCAIVPNEEVNYEYLFHNLRGRYKELRSMSGDVDGRGGLNLKHIQSIKVIVPPMSEQMKFVSIARQADKSGYDCYIQKSTYTINIA